jgi:hypothetical protein
MVDSASIESLDPQSEGELEYQPVERLAIVGLILGLLSPIALLDTVLWFVPILGLLTNVMALVSIRRDGRLGRTVALVGLALSTMFIVMPLSRILSAHVLLARQARPVAEQFLAYMREGSPEKAIMLNRAPDYRRPIDEGLWLFYRADDEARADLQQFVARPPIRMLLALGERAKVSFYKTASVATGGDLAQVDYWYSVTFDDEGRKKTYFIGLLLERKPTENPDINPWRVKDVAAGIDPRRTGWW